jgi:hypothetical protein
MQLISSITSHSGIKLSWHDAIVQITFNIFEMINQKVRFDFQQSSLFRYHFFPFFFWDFFPDSTGVVCSASTLSAWPVFFKCSKSLFLDLKVWLHVLHCCGWGYKLNASASYCEWNQFKTNLFSRIALGFFRLLRLITAEIETKTQD